MAKKKKADKVVADKNVVTEKDLKTIIASLNVFLKKKKLPACVIGKNKTTASTNFQACIEGLEEGVAGELPVAVIEFYNANFAEEDDSEEETVEEEVVEEKPKKGKKGKTEKAPKTEKPKKEPKVKEPSNEQLAYNMVEAGNTPAEILAAFTKRYKERGQTDKDYIAGRVEIYIHIANRKLGIPSANSKPSKPKKTKAEKTVEAPAEEESTPAEEKKSTKKGGKKSGGKKKKGKK